jgi:hypothetical protein
MTFQERSEERKRDEKTKQNMPVRDDNDESTHLKYD